VTCALTVCVPSRLIVVKASAARTVIHTSGRSVGRVGIHGGDEQGHIEKIPPP
jgi:hypothetical protein